MSKDLVSGSIKVRDLAQKGAVEYPEDVALFRSRIPLLALCTDHEIQDLYREYSDDMYSAGWMMVDPDMVSRFESWLARQVGQ